MQHLHFWQKKFTHRRYYNNGIRINIYCWEYLWISTYLSGTGKPKIKRSELDCYSNDKRKKYTQEYKQSS